MVETNGLKEAEESPQQMGGEMDMDGEWGWKWICRGLLTRTVKPLT